MATDNIGRARLLATDNIVGQHRYDVVPGAGAGVPGEMYASAYYLVVVCCAAAGTEKFSLEPHWAFRFDVETLNMLSRV